MREREIEREITREIERGRERKADSLENINLQYNLQTLQEYETPIHRRKTINTHYQKV